LAFVEWEKAREAALELAQRDEQERVAALNIPAMWCGEQSINFCAGKVWFYPRRLP
jgi:hypothetical protein